MELPFLQLGAGGRLSSRTRNCSSISSGPSSSSSEREVLAVPGDCADRAKLRQGACASQPAAACTSLETTSHLTVILIRGSEDTRPASCSTKTSYPLRQSLQICACGFSTHSSNHMHARPTRLAPVASLHAWCMNASAASLRAGLRDPSSKSLHATLLQQ